MITLEDIQLFIQRNLSLEGGIFRFFIFLSVFRKFLYQIATMINLESSMLFTQQNSSIERGFLLNRKNDTNNRDLKMHGLIKKLIRPYFNFYSIRFIKFLK